MRKLLLPLFALAASFATAQLEPETTIVTVNGEAVDAGTYYRRMTVLPNVGRLQDGQFVSGRPGFLTLQQLMNELLIIDLAEQEDVAPSEEEIEEEVQRRLAADPRFVDTFLGLGLTEEDVRHDVLVQLSEFNLITEGINITDLEVENHYNQYPQMYTIPESYELKVIGVATDEKMEQVDEALASGQDFAEVATEFSEDIYRFSGGDMGVVSGDNLTPMVKEALAEIEAGQSTDWIEGETTNFKFYLVDRTEAELQELDDALMESIRRRLAYDRGRVTSNLGERLNQMREEAEIEYSGTPFDRQLQQLFGGE
jgi:parvulin-like peptidyl-prolyl isomerase